MSPKGQSPWDLAIRQFTRFLATRASRPRSSSLARYAHTISDMKATSLKLGALAVGFGLSSLLTPGCASEAGSETDFGSIAEEGLTGSFAVGTDLQTNGEVNHRSSPSASAAILQVIPSGTRVKSAASQPLNGWYGVTWNGKTGWVAGTYLEKGTSTGVGASQSGKGLPVPYLNQYDDAAVNPGGSCGNTSTAMLLRFYGIQKSPDGVRATYDGGGDCGGGAKPWQCPEGLSRIQKSEGLKSRFSRTASRSTIKRQIDAGRPVIIHGNFTGVGHIMVVVGYDDSAKQWIVNDPSGRWCGGVGGGYSSCGGAYDSGKSRRYSYESFSNGVLGVDGDIWMSTASRSDFSL
jgi:hypothetical protein